ncbi:unnamed protein product [marine sediment metagenome]|uniref:Uncharacterized protein n=1 Tax=marine sediment metagenome TaxID=412755 RepID=X1B639_9ZZZZ
MNVMRRCFLCTPDGRIELVRLNKSTSTTNAALDSVQKGDIISIDNVIQTKPHYWQVSRHTHIKIMYKTTH